MVSTHMRGAVIPTSAYKGFLRACILRRGTYSSTLEPTMIVYKPDTQIKYEVLSVN